MSTSHEGGCVASALANMFGNADRTALGQLMYIKLALLFNFIVQGHTRDKVHKMYLQIFNVYLAMLHA